MNTSAFNRKPRRTISLTLAALVGAAVALACFTARARREFEVTGDADAGPGPRSASAPRLAGAPRGARAGRGTLVPAPQTPSDVLAMVEFCDTAGDADVPALREVALTASSPLAAGNAVRALGRLGAVAGDTELVKLLRDVRDRVRDETILALGESQDEAVLDMLEPLVREGDRHVRSLAICAIGRIGGERARTTLEKVIADPASATEAVAFARAGLAAPGG